MTLDARNAVYGGSFDPLTDGHMWVIEEAARLFHTVTVVVGTNPDKKYVFEEHRRYLLVAESVAHLPNVCVVTGANKYLVRIAREAGCHYLVRGVRSSTDFEYERPMRHMNEDLDSSVTTVFLIPPRRLVEVSSSAVKAMVGFEGWEDAVRHLVPPAVLDELRVWNDGRSTAYSVE